MDEATEDLKPLPACVCGGPGQPRFLVDYCPRCDEWPPRDKRGRFARYKRQSVYVTDEAIAAELARRRS
jgi:hypothetical protein